MDTLLTVYIDGDMDPILKSLKPYVEGGVLVERSFGDKRGGVLRITPLEDELPDLLRRIFLSAPVDAWVEIYFPEKTLPALFVHDEEVFTFNSMDEMVSLPVLQASQALEGGLTNLHRTLELAGHPLN